MEIAITIALVSAAFVFGGLYMYVSLKNTVIDLLKKDRQPPQVNVNLKPVEDKLIDLPHKVLESITASANTHKGALGELIGYLQIRASYDRIIPLGNIVDFMCIKFPTETTPGHVDFIDIKTGNRSRLSKDQRELQKLIKDGKINFIKLKVDTSNSEDITQ